MKNYWKALRIEIKEGITSNFLNVLKIFVVLFIPFLYAFTFLFAFFDPISNADQLKITLITQKNDYLGDFVKKETTKDSGVKIVNSPNLPITAKFEHIYSDEVNGGNSVGVNTQVVKDSFMTVVVPSMDDRFVEGFKNLYKNTTSVTAVKIRDLVRSVLNPTSGEKANVFINYKKNYITSMGMDISGAESGSLRLIFGLIFKALIYDEPGIAPGSNPNIHYNRFTNKLMSGTNPLDESEVIRLQKFADDHSHADNLDYMFTKENESNFHGLKAIEVHSELGTKETGIFGIGMSPFFITIGLWFGAVALTITIHRKVYDKTIDVRHRYMAKISLIFFGTILQVSILLLSLKLIGINAIGRDHWAIMYFSSLVISWIFGAIITSIRYSIASKPLSIYVVVIFMVLNIVASGGLFPVDTQNGFIQFLNKFMPMSFSVNILREGLWNTDWTVLLTNFGYLSIYLLFIPLGVALNFIHTYKWYVRNEWDMPPSMKRKHERHKSMAPTHLEKMKARGDKGGDV